MPQRPGEPGDSPFGRLRAADTPAPRGPSEGRRALFSDEPPVRPPLGGVVVACSRCSQRTVVTVGRAARALLPSVHLPLLRRRHPSYLRCPACGQFAWVRLGVS